LNTLPEVTNKKMSNQKGAKKMKEECVESDLGCAAFLASNGYTLIGTREVSPRRTGFVFEDPLGTAPRHIAQYFAGALVQAERFAIEIRKLKTALRVAKESQETKKEKEYAYHARNPR
jgi:Domain of unknown function (DUF5659)